MNQADRHGFENFDVVLFDLDGVITKTAVLHATAWKRLFDEYLKKLAARTRSGYKPFDPSRDYRFYVDGKSRFDGVKDFLKSRNVPLPLGSPNDGPDQETIYGLGSKKDEYFEGCLRETGVVVYPGTVRYLHAARAAGLKAAVVSSSHHCREIIQSVGLTALFETRIDGYEIDRLHLPGKPDPDTFLEAARRLGVSPEKTDRDRRCSRRGPGRTGRCFGLVIGVNRENQADALRQHGADIVVDDLTEMLPSEPATEPFPAPPAKN